MNSTSSIVRKLNANARRKFAAAAATVPADVIAQIKSRVVEAVTSGEPHKATGGWVILPLIGKADICGLLEIAASELRAEQKARFAA